jgi:diguanylate cyclase (GGDEF)-like protein
MKNMENHIPLMLDHIPLCCQVWDKDINIINCNKAIISLFGLKSKQEYIDRFYELSPEHQPNGQNSIDKIKICLEKAFAGGNCVFSWMHQMLDGTLVPSEITLVKIEHEGNYFVVSYIRDLREHEWMIDEIQQQTNLLQTVNKVSAIMLQSHTNTFESDLILSMGVMAKAVNVDRMYIWKNYTKGGQLYCHQIYEWSGGAGSQKDYKYAVETRYSDIVPEWELLLPQGNCINNIVRKMSESEKMALAPQGILSILVVPIFLNKQFWGFIGFDDCHEERLFSEKEEQILRSASQLIANALIRNEEEEKIHQAEEYTKLMLDATPLSIQLWNNTLDIIDCNEAAVSLFGVESKQEFINRFHEFSPEFQPDGQNSYEKGRMHLEKTFNKGYNVFDWMHRMPDGTLIPAEVTLVRVKYRGIYVVAGYIKDLRVLKNLEEKAEAAYYDALTGIYNRRYLDENLEHLIKNLSRSCGTLSLLMIDIDWFKKYNDVYGHGEGDKCLKIVSGIISKTLSRESDFVARYGGEEFTVVLPNTDKEGACMIAEKLLENIRKARIAHCKSDVAEYVTISIGVATGVVNHMQTCSDYIKLADEMLYKSKQFGRNRLHSAVLN